MDDEQKASFRGFALLEVVIASALVLFIAAGIALSMKGNRSSGTVVNSQETCSVFAQSLLDNVKNFDNSLTVRSWLPGATNMLTANDLRDPYCNNVTGRTPVCDTKTYFDMAGSFVINGTLRNSQNVRGAATWAQSVYNSTGSAICSTPAGKSFTPTQGLGDLLPKQVAIPSSATDVSLFIQEKDGVPCGVSSTLGVDAQTGYKVRFTIGYMQGSTGIKASCTTEGIVNFPKDFVKPTVSVVVKNGAGLGTVIPPNGCTCQRTPAAAAGGCPEAYNIALSMQSSEPGTLLLCNRRGPLADDDGPALTSYVSCADLTFSGAGTTVVASAPTYNQANPIHQVNLMSLPAKDDDSYIVNIRNADTAGNISSITQAIFRVKIPTCDNPNNYCPGVALPPDSCGNSDCGTGTRVGVGCPAAGTLCIGQSIVKDDCGSPCPGTDPGNCAAVNLATLACGTFAPNSCGVPNACGPGSQGCPTPTATPTATATAIPTPTPTPIMSCVSTGCPAPNTAPCGTALFDNCFNPCSSGTAPLCPSDTTYCGPLSDACGNVCAIGSACGTPTPTGTPLPTPTPTPTSTPACQGPGTPCWTDGCGCLDGPCNTCGDNNGPVACAAVCCSGSGSVSPTGTCICTQTAPNVCGLLSTSCTGNPWHCD